MQRMKESWKRLPDSPRRILTFILGMLLVLSAPLFGAIPGPGGMIIFLLGIAVLATEFSWAERLRDTTLVWLKRLGRYARHHPAIATSAIIGAVLGIAIGAYAFYNYVI